MKKILGNIIGVRVKRLTIIAVLLALIAGSFITIPVNANDDIPTGSKISSALSMHVQMKTHQLSEAGNNSPDEVTLPGMDSQSLENPVELAYEKVFLSFTQQPSQTQISELEALGVTVYPDSWIPPVGSHTTGFVLAKMPVGALNSMAAKDFIMQMDTAEQAFYPQNDAARTATGVNDVWAGSNTGAGVTVAVLDSGIDTSNPDFPTLNTSNSKDYSSYPTLDNTITNTVTGHGTHVTGSVLGRGVNSATYKGMAPGADLVFLKIGNDTTGGASSDAMVYAIRAAADTYHADIISISYGGWSTYHDGSDAICQAVDYAVSQGVTVFASAGNEADSGWHYSGTVSAGGTTDYIQINVSSGSSYLSTGLVWYDGLGTHNMLTLQYYNSSHSLLSPVSSGQSESNRGTETNQYQMGSSVPTGTYYFKVHNSSGVSQSFHIYYYGGAYTVAFLNFNQHYTISSPAEADGAIAVGAYVSRSSWTNYKGDEYTYGESTGTTASFSARGPRVDTGAPQKPDFVAPGSAIISVRDPIYTPGNSSYDPLIIDNDGLNLNGSGPANYYVIQGTSMACPVAAGIGALLLSKDPTLTPEHIRYVLESSASNPSPNDNDGWGLIRAAIAINVNDVFYSYRDSSHTIPCNDFNRYSIEHTVYLKSSSFNGRTYNVTYYDGANNKIATHSITGGTYHFVDQYTFTPGLEAPGSWHVIVTHQRFTPPATYDPTSPYTIVTATFNVQNSAIYPGYPEITTNEASNITSADATLNATVNSFGTSGEISTAFEYGLTTAYGTTIIADPATMTELGSFSANITGLTPGKIYHFRAIADGGENGIAISSDMTFYTWADFPTGQIVFTSQRDGNEEIYIMNGDGSNQTRLTNNNINDEFPELSPDGSKITFCSNGNICVMDVDGTNLTVMTSGSNPTWSPDGTKIVFSSNTYLFIMDSDGTDIIQLTDSPPAGGPCFSPDGTKIVFLSSVGSGGTSEICVINVGGSNFQRLTNNYTNDGNPRWSPDGTKIVYQSDGDFTNDYHSAICVMNSDGTGQITLTNRLFSDNEPTWSPDGTKIAFSSDRLSSTDLVIFVMDADGGNIVNLMNSGSDNFNPRWTAGTVGDLISVSIYIPPSIGVSVDELFTTQPVILVKDRHGNAKTGVTVTASLKTGSGQLRGILTTVTDVNGLATFTNLGYSKSGELFTIHFVAGIGSIDSNQLGPLSAGTAVQVRIETAGDSSGTVVGNQNLPIGDTITVYGVTRDQFENYVGNPTDTIWCLTDKTGGVADSDLSSTFGSSVTMTGNTEGTAIIHATNGSLTPGNSGTITVINLTGKIVFSSNRDLTFYIYIMNADGTDLKRLVGNGSAVSDMTPVLSPNGRKIVYVSGGKIWVIDSDGNNPKQLTDTNGKDPAWSPDGMKIAYTSNNHICIMNSDGSNRNEITTGLYTIDNHPTWSPDGTIIAFSRYTMSWQLYIINIDGSNMHSLASGDAWEPVWSPDGTKIAYRSNISIYIINSNGSGKTLLTSGSSPAWSPDGTKILFVTGRTGGNQIWIMSANGQNQLPFISGSHEWSPSWSNFVASGLLRVQTVPAVPTRIYIDGIPRDDWGLNWVKMEPGSYTLSFSDVFGFNVPTSVTVNYYPGTTGNFQSLSDPINIYANVVTEVIVNFEQLGNLRVEVSPPLPATVFCNGHPMDDWGFWCNIEPGDYTISFQDMDGYITPEPQVVTVNPGYETTHIVGTYEAGENDVEAPTVGLLRVQTNPAVSTRIFLDGLPRNDWGLNWVKMTPGSYVLSLSDVYGYNTPTSITVNYYPGTTGNVQALTNPINIYADTVTEVIVNFVQLGNLRVETSPAVPATIYCNGNPMDDWGFWCNIEPGEYTISFEPKEGYLTPPPIVVTVVAGAGTHVVGNYTTGASEVVP